MDPDVVFRQAMPADLAAIKALQPRAFGPGRFARTAYRVREGVPLVSRFCLVAARGDVLIAAIRFTEVMIGAAPGALLLGPLAVDPDFAGLGYGRRLVADGLDRAGGAGARLAVLVGDQAYYARFGFKPVPPGQIWFPGPADPTRILAAELVHGALADFHGVVSAGRG